MSAKPKEEPQIEMIRQHVRAVIAELESAGHEMIRVADVSPRVQRKIDRKHQAPSLVEYCSIQGISQTVRSELRGHYQGEEEEDGSLDQIDFDQISVPHRFNLERQGQRGYVLADNCTPEEVEIYVLKPMLKSNQNRQRRYDVIKEWNDRRR